MITAHSVQSRNYKYIIAFVFFVDMPLARSSLDDRTPENNITKNIRQSDHYLIEIPGDIYDNPYPPASGRQIIQNIKYKNLRKI